MKIRRSKVFKSKTLIHLHFWSEINQTFFKWTWRAGPTKKIIFYFFCKFDLPRKKLESSNFMGAALLCANISQIFFLNWIIKNICCCLSKNLFIFSHPSTSLLECQLILLKKPSSTEMGFNSYQNIIRKWNWFQIFLSEMHLSPKNESRGAFFLISSFLKGLTYSALWEIYCQSRSQW